MQNDAPDKPFAWTGRSELAAVLCAEDVMSDAAIAEEISVKRDTITRWRRHPEFQARITEHVAALQERARADGLGRLDKRKAAAEDRHRRMTLLIEARAEEMAGEVAGGETGLLVRQYKSIGTGPNARQVTEYTFDAALVREMRETEKHIAQDTGDWSEKREVSGPDGAALTVLITERADGPK